MHNSMKSFSYTDFRKQRLRSEAEILADWMVPYQVPQISVVCTTFNQRKYVEDALRGFLLQRTRKPFEILVHDDVSSDGTTEIVQDYARRYPRIIRAIVPTENQYSKGNWPLLRLLREARGEFVAICEGDDFWISDFKLQRQVDALAGSSADAAIHAALSEETTPRLVYKRVGFYQNHAGIIPHATAVPMGGAFCATASLMLRKSFVDELPSWLSSAPVLDTFLIGLGSLRDGLVFLPQEMCVYRVMAENSWSRTSNYSYVTSERLLSYQLTYENYLGSLPTQYRNDISRMQSSALLSGAISSIRFGHAADFRSRIEDSWKLHPGLNTTQVVLYRLRQRFVPLRALHRIYKRIS